MIIETILKKLIKVGKVSEVNYETASCKVVFEDLKGFQTQNLQVLHRKTLKHKSYDMPDIDELVVCIFLPYANNFGIILGSIYTDENKPLCQDDRVQYKFEDGTYIEYDKSTKQATVDCQGDVVVKSKTNIYARAEESIECEAKAIKGAAGEIITLEAPVIKIKGDITLDGDVTATAGIVVSDDVICSDTITSKGSVNGHKHTGNMGVPTSPML